MLSPLVLLSDDTFLPHLAATGLLEDVYDWSALLAAYDANGTGSDAAALNAAGQPSWEDLAAVSGPSASQYVQDLIAFQVSHFAVRRFMHLDDCTCCARVYAGPSAGR